MRIFGGKLEHVQGWKMPLAIVSGIPAAGKTVFSQNLVLSLQEKFPDYKFCLINDESLNISKSTGYCSILHFHETFFSKLV
jgi:tRNA uridine 5-carbamoylmethylation protein Kti12